MTKSSPRPLFPQATRGIAWRQESVQPRAVRFLWNPRFLKHALDGDSALTIRSAASAQEDALVLADVLVMDDETISIEAQLIISEKKQNPYALHMRLLAATPSNTRARVTLQWGGKTFTTAFKNGRAVISNLPPISAAHTDADEPSPAFSLTLELKPRRKE